MTRLRIALLVLLGLFSAGAAMGAQAKERCLDGLKPALLAGGFSGSTDCGRDALSVARIGTVRAHGREYTVFDYRYELASKCRDCAIHGGQRILFFRAGRYVGQYKPDSADLAIVGGRLVLSPTSGMPGARPVTLRLTRRGPPRQVWFDGSSLEFFR